MSPAALRNPTRLEGLLLEVAEECSRLQDRVMLYAVVAEALAEEVCAEQPAAYSALTNATNDLRDWMGSLAAMIDEARVAAADVTAIWSVGSTAAGVLDQHIAAHQDALAALRLAFRAFKSAELRLQRAGGTAGEDEATAALEESEALIESRRNRESEALRRLLLGATNGEAEARRKATYLLDCDEVMRQADGAAFRRLLQAMAGEGA